MEELSKLGSITKDCNLQLVFESVSGGYLANVMVEIQDDNGKKLIAASSSGPWFFAKLPAGEYRVTVVHHDQHKVRTVNMGKGSQTVMFHWKP